MSIPPRLARRSVRRLRNRGRRFARGIGSRVVPVHERLDDLGVVALTFDDGPNPRYTPAVLDELARLGAVATFFLVGARAAEHPALVRRIVAEGHAIGSHSASHPDPWTCGLRTLAADYRRGRALVEAASGTAVSLFRPPKGHWDTRGVIAARAAGLRPWRWNVDPEDWQPGATVRDILAGVAGVAGGDVVLLHDAIEGPLAASALDRSATVEALDGIVAHLRAQGLRTVTLS